MRAHDAVRLRDALGYVPPHDRDLWLRIGMAVKAELGEDGFSVWNEWSQADESYNERDAKSVWKSIRAAGKVTIGTLFHEAKQRGWRGEESSGAGQMLSDKRAEREQRRQREQEAEARRRQDAQREAAEIWDSSKSAPEDHAYLARKSVRAHGVRIYSGSHITRDMSCDGALLVPIRNAASELCSLEFISPDGEKRFLPGGRKSGGYFFIGQYAGVIAIAEGFATGASVHESIGHATAVAFDKGNLRPVAVTLRGQFPDARIVIASDDDYQTAGNPGMRASHEAAAAVGGLVAVPDFGVDRPDGAKDFNDMTRIRGADAVRAAIEGATAPSIPVPPAAYEHSDAKSSSAPIVRCLADVTPVPVSWLWPGRIARGKVTLIAGDPGLGKSQLTAALAACVSVGGRWPVDRSHAPTGNVLILNAEDDAADTIRPRLDAAGANVARIHVLEAIGALDGEGRLTKRTFDLSRDIEALGAAARRIGNVTLIIIDPISAYLGGTDSHRNADIRGLLAPLASVAGVLDAAIVAVSHLNKSSSSDALMRVTGSLAFVAAARAAFLVVKDAQEPARRLFVSAKNNLGPDQGNGLAFRVVPVTLEDGISTSRLEWEPEPVTITANEALAAVSADTEERSALTDAMQFLRDLLATGPISSKEVERLAKADGHAVATIRRARNALGVVIDKEGFRAGWRWSLPAKMLRNTEDAQAKDVSIFGSDEHLRKPTRNEGEPAEVEL
jgi:putative DNA primase/helicase